MRPTYQRGLSLVELLIAMTLSLLLMAGVLQVFLASKNTYLTNMALAELQENGRFALDAMAHDLRNAGFKGACLAGVEDGTGSFSELYSLDQSGINGFGDKAKVANWVPAGRKDGTDALLVKYSADMGLKAQLIVGDTITLAEGGAKSDAFYVLSDQRSCRIVKNANKGPTKITADISLEHFLESATQAYPYRYAIYWIGTGADGNRALFITDSSDGKAKELVPGIAGLSLRYGVKDDGTDAVGPYKSAEQMSAEDWPKVLAVRISLVLQSSSANVVEEPMSVVLDGKEYPDPKGPDAPDHRLRMVVSTTAAVRNYLP